MARDGTTGLIIAADHVEWAVVEQARSSAEPVIRTGRFDIEEPAAEAEPGSESAADAAERLRAVGRDVKGRLVAGMLSDQALLRIVRLPAVETDELRDMVQLQVDKIAPFPVDEMVVDFEVLRREGNDLLVLIAAARETTIDGVGRRIEESLRLPDRVDVDVLGWWHHVAGDDELKGERRHVVLRLEPDCPGIIVVENAVPVAFRALGRRRDLTGEEAAEEVARDVGRTLLGLELEMGAAAVGSALLFSRGPAPRRLAEALTQECGCEVVQRDLDEVGTAVEGIVRRTLRRGERPLDLTPPAWREARAARFFKRRLIGAGAAVLGLWLVLVGTLAGGVAWQRGRLGRLTVQRDAWRAPANDVRDMRRRVGMIGRYMDRSRSALECLREITAALPGGVDLTSLTYRKAESIKLAGEAASRNLVLMFTDNLTKSDLFTEVNLGSQSIDRRRNKTRFDMDLVLPAEE